MPPAKGRGRGGSKAAANAAAVAKLRKPPTAPSSLSKTATEDKKPQAGERNSTTGSKRGGKAATTTAPPDHYSKESKAAPESTGSKPPAKKKKSVAAPVTDRTASKTASTTADKKKSRAKEDTTKGTTRTSAAKRKTTGAGAAGRNTPAGKTAPTKTKVPGAEEEKGGPLSDADDMLSGQKHRHLVTETEPQGPRSGALLSVVVAGGFFAVTGWAMASLFGIQWRHVDDVMACRTPECKLASEYLNKILVKDKAPCVDFYSRVCGTWNGQGRGFHADGFTAALKAMNASMFMVGKALNLEDELRGMHILKPLYRKCYRYMSALSDLREEMAYAEKALSVSELLRATSFVAIVRYLVRTALRIGIFGLFDVRFVRVGNRSLLQLRRGYSLHGKVGASLEVGDANYRITKLVTNWLGKENVTAETEMLFRLDAEVRRVFSKSVPQTLKPLDEVTSKMMDLTSEQWAATINEAHDEKELKLKPSDTVIDTDMASVHEASRYLVGEGVNATAFYVATNIEADVIYLVYTKLARVHLSTYGGSCMHEDGFLKFGDSATSDISSNRLRQAGFCMFLVRKCVSLTWPSLAAQLLLSKTDSVPVLESLYSSLQQIAEVALRSPPSMAQLIMYDLEEAGHVSFAYALNSVVVPTMWQLVPFLYTTGVPDQYNYGAVGSLLAARLVDALLAEGDGGKGAWYPAAKDKGEKIVECLVARHHRQGFGRKVAGSSQSQRNAMLALSSGVRLAYAALEAIFLSQVASGRAIKENWPHIQEVFFIRYCLLWCSGTSTPNPITPNEMCLLPLYNMREFGELYKCPGKSNYSAAGDLCDV
ncbi:hypothetical protein V5799_010945 [Amblyomma americanum]|uniref:M13 family peptidase n=1 Tax=Amblyomma americanum TaxID=6943 RepID=A0AAQ4EIN0_AMBAM